MAAFLANIVDSVVSEHEGAGGCGFAVGELKRELELEAEHRRDYLIAVVDE